MRLLLLPALAVAAVAIAPTSSPANRPTETPAEKTDDALRAKVRELEERLARVEKQLTVPALETVSFGDVVVNLSEDRQQRYLRIKVAFLVEEASAKEMHNLVVKKKAELKSWAITYLAGQTVKDVSGTNGVKATNEALLKGFSEILTPAGKKSPLKGVLFEEYVVQ